MIGPEALALTDLSPGPAAMVAQADPQALYEAAVQDRLAGRNAEAARKLEVVLAARPDDVDARLNLGLALLASGRLDGAEAAFREVIRRTPDYADAWIGLARVEQRRGNVEAARAAADEAARRAPGNAEAVALAASLAGGGAVEVEPRWRVDVSASRSRLSGGLPDWTEARVAVSRPMGGGWTGGLAVEATERFDDRDVYLEARVDRAFLGGGAYVSLGGAPDADYRPEVALSAGAEVRVAPGLFATLDGSVARYPTGTVVGLHPGVAADLADGRLRLAARWINVRDETGERRDGYAVSGRWQATDRLALRAGWADAPESSEGVTVDVKAWSAGAEIGLTEELALRLGYVDEDRGAYDRSEVSVGLGWRF